jgi:hypothetical protein
MGIKIKWNDCDEAMACQLSGITFAPGRVYPYQLDALQESIQLSMPGLKETFVSGYLNSQATIDPAISGLGELAVILEAGGIMKSYNFIFAKDAGGSMYFAGPYKDLEEHHWSGVSPLPIEKLFGNTPLSS